MVHCIIASSTYFLVRIYSVSTDWVSDSYSIKKKIGYERNVFLITASAFSKSKTYQTENLIFSKVEEIKKNKQSVRKIKFQIK